MYGKLQKAVDRLNNVVQENLTAIRAVKAFVRGEAEEERFQVVNSRLADTSKETFRWAVLNLPSLQLTMYTAIVLIMWFGGNMILDGDLLVGDLTGFLSYVFQVMNSMMMLSNVFLLLTRSLASVHRITQVLEEQPQITSPQDAVTQVADGSVDFEGVSFKYHADAQEYALSQVDLQSRRGRLWAFWAAPARPRAPWYSSFPAFTTPPKELSGWAAGTCGSMISTPCGTR